MSTADNNIAANTTHPVDRLGRILEELGWPSSSEKRSCAARRNGSNGGPSGEFETAL